MCKLSVIIISYNEKEYLEDAFLSCNSQTFDDVEVIFADDGSSDGSIDLIRQLSEQYKNVRYFVMDRDPSEKVIASIRVSNLIKRALSESSGEYCVILSGDDKFCDDSKFGTAIDYLDHNPDYFSVASGFKIVYPDKEKSTYPCIPTNNLFFGCSYLHISCFIFRKPDADMLLDRLIDDTGLVYVIALAGKIKVSKRITFMYFQRKGSIMHSLENLEGDLIELMLYQDFLNYRDRTGRYMNSSVTKQIKSIRRCFFKRKSLQDSQYEKYLESCSRYKNDIISQLIYDYDKYSLARKISFHMYYFRMNLLSKLYTCVFLMFKVPNKITELLIGGE